MNLQVFFILRLPGFSELHGITEKITMWIFQQISRLLTLTSCCSPQGIVSIHEKPTYRQNTSFLQNTFHFL